MLLTELAVNSNSKGGVTLGLTVERHACLPERNEGESKGLAAYRTEFIRVRSVGILHEKCC